MHIGVFETNLSNKFSIFHALEHLGFNTSMVEDFKDIEKTDILIIPGVGNFKHLMENLRQKDLVNPIKERASKDQKILGICIGMQILFSESEEGNSKGLSILDGKVINLEKKFSNYKIITPNIGWRKTNFINDKFKKYEDNYFYFVHEYEVIPTNKNDIMSHSKVGNTSVVSSVNGSGSLKNIYGLQFHPEKSGLDGINFLKDLIKFISKN